MRFFTLLLTLFAAFVWAEPESVHLRFSKIHQQGHEIPAKSGPWHCVLDKQTNLLWEVKSVQEGANYYNSTYSWWNAALNLGTQDTGSCALGEGFFGCDTQDLVDLYQRLNLCGASRWRLPTIMELDSLLNHQAYPGQPLVPAGLFPLTVLGPYWSQTLSQDQLQIQTLHFGSGERGLLAPSGSAWLRLVSDVDSPLFINTKHNHHDKEH